MGIDPTALIYHCKYDNFVVGGTEPELQFLRKHVLDFESLVDLYGIGICSEYLGIGSAARDEGLDQEPCRIWVKILGDSEGVDIDGDFCFGSHSII